MEEVEARRKQEEEARRLRRLQQVRGQVGEAPALGRVGRAWMCLSPGVGLGGPCGFKPGGGSTNALKTWTVTVTCLPFSLEVTVWGVSIETREPDFQSQLCHSVAV